MRKNIYKYLMYFTLGLMLVIGILPYTSLVANANTTIMEVAITAPKPVAGEKPCYDKDQLVMEGNYYIEGKEDFFWYYYDDEGVYQKLTAEETFQDGIEYTLNIENLIPETGYSFPSNNTTGKKALVNGEEAYIYWSSSRTPEYTGCMSLEYTFPPAEFEKTKITSIEFFHEDDIITGSYVRNLPVSKINGTEAGKLSYYAPNTWYRHTENFSDISVAKVWPTDEIQDMQFEYGKAYALKIDFLREITGYEYSSNVEVILRTPSGTMTGIPDGNGAYLFFWDVLTKKPILGEVKISMQHYGPGLSMGGLTFTSNDPVVTTGGYSDNVGIYTIKKQDGDEYVTISASTNFSENTTYYLAYYLKTTSEYDLSYLTPDKVSVNGIYAISRTQTNNGIMYLFELTTLVGELVEVYSIELVMPKEHPVVGETQYYPTVVSVNDDPDLASKADAMNSSIWYEGDLYNKEGYFKPMTSFQFSEGKAYLFKLRVNMKESNYHIQNNCTVTLKTPFGETLVGEWNCQLSTVIMYNYYFNLGAPTEYPPTESYHAKMFGYQQGANISSISLKLELNGKEVNEALEYGDAFIIACGEEFQFENVLFEGKFAYDTQYFLVLPVMLNGGVVTKDMVSLNGMAPEELLQVDKEVVYAIFKLPILKQGVECNGLDHTFQEVMTQATFDSDGKIYEECSKGCGTTRNEVKIAKVSTVELSATTYTYDGKTKQPVLIIKDSQGNILEKDKDYTVTYPEASKDIGTYTCEVVLKGNYSGTKILTYKIKKEEIATVSLSKTKYTYNGKPNKPSVKVKNTLGIELTNGIHYTVAYENNIKVGKATVIIKGKGAYEGTIIKNFTINPKTTKITALEKGKKSFTIKWSKKKQQTTGYEIYYTTSKTRKNGKSVTIAKNATTKKTIKKLKSKKKYYVWVRTYKKVEGKKYYSVWSNRKAVKIK